MEALELARFCARLAHDKKGEAVCILDMRRILPIADYFVVATGGNRRQLQAVADEIRRQCREHGLRSLGSEGMSDGRWVLIDYGEVVVHVFQPDERSFYDLENLWGDAPRVAWEEPVLAKAVRKTSPKK